MYIILAVNWALTFCREFPWTLSAMKRRRVVRMFHQMIVECIGSNVDVFAPMTPITSATCRCVHMFTRIAHQFSKRADCQIIIDFL